MTDTTEGPMIRRENWGITHTELMCEPIRVLYDFRARIGYVFMADGDCCDMTGCVNFFKRMDQDVEVVFTHSEGRIDTSYWRDAKGEWHARTFS
jgi:hypothetical protein